jgi:2-keto-4-pentenoate hydratase/2-oxohepta-3-ene-1,7-dioic acid hydratase in catechol pathway
MRVGRFGNGAAEVTAVERDGAWFLAEVVGDGAEAPSTLDMVGGEGVASSRRLDGELRPTVPWRPPRNVMCLGKNFREHAEEFAAYAAESEAVPTQPIVFTKAPDALCGAEDAIEVRRDLATALDYEVELAVVIGRGGTAIDVENAYDHVAGYTVLNDVTARDLQERHRQWFLGKSLPRATPIGPVLVTPDELGALDELAITSWVNGEVRQKALLGEMIFGVPETIAIVSAIVPLRRGDLISMGTPSGVGIGFKPPRFLNDGDEVVCEIEGIGRLHNVVRLLDQAPALAGPDASGDRGW